MYKYHIQYQAIERANTILPVPEDYPLKHGIYAAFRADFAQFMELVKKIYIDIAEHPESYGLLLLPITEGRELLDSIKSLRKPFYALYALARSGEIESNTLRVHVQSFRENIKQAKAGNLNKYNLILNKFLELGFELDGYNGKDFTKEQDYFTVSFPSNPVIIHALKTYADFCTEHLTGLYGDDAPNPYRVFVLMDYKYTADLSVLPEIVWVYDRVRFWDEEARAFHIAFYEQAIKNPQIRWKSSEYSSDFYRGKKQIARMKYSDRMHKFNVVHITNPEYKNIMKNLKGYADVVFSIHLYLPIKGKDDRFDRLPLHIIEYMKSNNCSDCNTFSSRKAKNDGKCPHTVYWTHNGEQQKSCSYHCFDFEQPRIEDVAVYCDLL